MKVNVKKYDLLYWVLVVITMTAFARHSQAQESVSMDAQKTNVPLASGKLLEPGSSQLGFWSGYSADNPTWMGRTHDRPYFELDVEYSRVILARDTWALKYNADIVPASIVRQPQQGYEMSGGKVVPVDLPGKKETIHGIGVTPAGLQLNFLRGSIVQPYIKASAGVLYFNDKVPVADSSKFNFSLGLGGGIEIWHAANQAVVIGYTYHHISNGYTARFNPGLDSDLYYLGYSWSWQDKVARF